MRTRTAKRSWYDILAGSGTEGCQSIHPRTLPSTNPMQGTARFINRDNLAKNQPVGAITGSFPINKNTATCVVTEAATQNPFSLSTGQPQLAGMILDINKKIGNEARLIQDHQSSKTALEERRNSLLSRIGSIPHQIEQPSIETVEAPTNWSNEVHHG